MRPSLIGGMLFSLTQLPAWRRTVWRRWYDTLARRDTDGQLLFMNYGYHDDRSPPLALQPADEPFRYAIQLYARALSGVDLAAKDVLEVGCGRGGGGSFVVRYLNPRSYTGVDISSEAIKRCKQDLSLPRATWLEGSADKIPAATSSMDVVMNVESSHTYPSMPAFLQEVNRVLRPGGSFAFADVRRPDHLPELAKQMREAGFVCLEQASILQAVLRSLNGITEQREAQITASVPAWFRPAFRDFAGVRNTVVHEMLTTGEMQYVCWRLQKPVHAR